MAGEPFTAYNTIAANTLGLFWKLGGSVDPRRNDNLAIQEAHDNLGANGLDQATVDQATYQAEIDTAKVSVEESVKSSAQPCPGVLPTDVLGAWKCSLSKFGVYIVAGIVVIGGVYLYGKKLQGGSQ